MIKLFKKLLCKNDQKGQALAIVLVLLAIGSLTIAVNLNYATASLKGSGISAEDMRGVYAADAGVEAALWSLASGNATPTNLNINQMAVSINATVGSQILTLYLNDLQVGVHSDTYHITSNITPAGGNTYNYTITLITDAGAKNQASVQEIGALLPFGYTYLANSAVNYRATNLSYVLNHNVPDPQLDNPSSTGYDSGGNQWLKWNWANKGPEITNSSNYTEKFQITGTGSTFGSYPWIMGSSNDIGTVGQVTGALTTITATARRPQDGKITAKIKVDVIKGSGGVYVFTWQITK